MIRRVVIYPDKRLKEISKEVKSFDSELHKLLDDMYDTMIDKAKGWTCRNSDWGGSEGLLIYKYTYREGPEGGEQAKGKYL